ncbi:unnamed protein product [Adineta ricciae]|uniref:Myotubularin phosphatase domain-containing protein n=1 Tax=Adineta ricciae TaxID=249248 RepID=A0A813TG25_ADIRI|nr:unnamed protein product [Adineta ricciae]CAF0871538.1 unnamed protein product [Adineta ricciae]
MSFHRNTVRTRSISTGPHQSSRFYSNESESDDSSRIDYIPSILPEIAKIVRKLLPQETPLHVHVRNVEYIENGCQRLNGTLYMTIFRLIFAPDNDIDSNNLIASGNRYIGEYDIPLASIYRIIVAPVDSRSGFRSFLNENQIQSETRSFTIITRDFRNLTFSKCSVTKSNSLGSKQQTSTSQMEKYISSLQIQYRCQHKEQLYLFHLIQKPPANNLNSRHPRSRALSPITSSSSGRSADDEIADFCLSNDERIKSYMTYQDWNDELYEANERQWVVNHAKFDKSYIARTEGPYVRLTTLNERENLDELIWHWTHTPDASVDHRQQYNREQMQYMLITIPDIGEITVAGDPFRRNDTDASLTYSHHYIHERTFHRYNLAKFPCNLKRLQTTYEKLLEICTMSCDDDDEKWLTKLQACKWLKYVSKTLHGAASLAKLLNCKHIELAGSDTDNNCLMASLIQIFLRPHCRTIKGFCELIVREWIVRGHPFRERFGQVLSDVYGSPAQEAPVFLLFLDCVYQLINQNPFAFEFTEYLLLELYHNVCYCYQHTFALNSVLERLDAISNCPKSRLILSAFDFSLYLLPDIVRLLKNHAALIIPPRSATSISHTRSKSSTEHSPGRFVYRLEKPKPPNYVRQNSLPSPMLDSEYYEYDNIEAPQTFIHNFQVDWRIFNIVLWSKCYCRYDQNYFPNLFERQLSFEISCLQDDIKHLRAKSRRQPPIDSFHSIHYTNSWHPQMLETHV